MTSSATNNTNPAKAGERGVAMTTSALSSIPQVAALRPEWVEAHAHQPERILSAIGHPGYGRAYARKVLGLMADTGRSAHEVIYRGAW